MKKTIQIGLVSVAMVGILSGCFDQSAQPTPDANQSTGAPQNASMAKAPWLATKNTTRINSSDPFEAATLVSKTLWPATGADNRPGGVVLLDPTNWQTAAVSTDLIHFPNNGPVLFTKKDEVPEVTLSELKRLKPAGPKENQGVQVILVGDLDKKVEDQMKTLGLKTDRIQANNPADYAKQIDAYYAKVSGSLPESVVVGSMDSPEFTLPAVNWISHMPEPLLYVKKDEVPNETIEALKNRNGKANIYLLGPDSVVSSKVEEQLKVYGKVTRISGKDPYENAIAFAKFKDNSTQFGWGITTPGHNVSLVNKDSIALAIAAAPFSHLGKHAPLLWTDKEKMPSSVMSYLMSIQPKYKMSPSEGPYNHAWLTGDENSLTPNAQSEIDSMLEITSQSGGGHAGMPGMGGAGGTDNSKDTNTKTDSSSMPGMKH